MPLQLHNFPRQIKKDRQPQTLPFTGTALRCWCGYCSGHWKYSRDTSRLRASARFQPPAATSQPSDLRTNRDRAVSRVTVTRTATKHGPGLPGARALGRCHCHCHWPAAVGVCPNPVHSPLSAVLQLLHPPAHPPHPPLPPPSPARAMAAPRRPLPVPPPPLNTAYPPFDDAAHDEYMGMPASYPYSAYISPFPYQAPFTREPEVAYDGPGTSTLRGGTLLHKGFYDLLSLIPSTPSPSRLFWRAQNDEPVAGPRYEQIPPDAVPTATDVSLVPQSPPPRSPPPVKNLKARRISKDMVSKPTNFMYVRNTLYRNTRQFRKRVTQAFGTRL